MLLLFRCDVIVITFYKSINGPDMKKTNSLLTAIAMLSFLGCAATVAQETTFAPDGAIVYIVSPSNGDVVNNPVKVIFGLSGMGIAPAGTNIENTGHHHLIIDSPLPDTSLPVPSDDHHLHFGKGQTETVLNLTPGEHTLQLLLGDWLHKPHDKVIKSEKITISVQ